MHLITQYCYKLLTQFLHKDDENAKNALTKIQF